jgi:hypothetical protein
LIEASGELESLRVFGENLNSILKAYSGRLESLREKVEGAARLHHLLALKLNEADVQMEMQKLAEKIGLSSLMQKSSSSSIIAYNGNSYQLSSSCSKKASTGKMTITTTTITTSTPKKEKEMLTTVCSDHQQQIPTILPAIEESPEKKLETIAKACQEEDIDDIDDDDLDTSTTTMTSTSKTFGDSGLGTSLLQASQIAAADDDAANELKEEEDKLLRACSCESIVDDATMNACDNISQHENDDLDDYDTSENITSISLDEQPSKSESINNMAPCSVPLQANAHLYCHASNLQLDLDDTIIDHKTQK